jgi:putative hydrolase
MVFRARELSGDYHVHSTFSDDAVSTVEQNLAAAVAAGLTTVRFIDHVRASTGWVPQFVATVAALEVPTGLTVLTGVETKLMDVAGTLDLPPNLHVDAVVIADHQFPGADGPWTPTETRERIAAGELTGDGALEQLVTAYINAMQRMPGSQLAHPFSILPKVGLDESQLTAEQLLRWASTAADTGTLVELNEKWSCPSVRTLRAARAAGAVIVCATDAHDAAEVGVYSHATVAALRESLHESLHESPSSGDWP